jgi:cysteine-rich repeat protein
MNRVTFSIPTVGFLSLSLFAGCGEEPPAPFCGDGAVNAGEECDDANNIDTDECPSTCLEASCGDSFVQAGQEECDDANNIDGDTCTNDCTNAECGDGIIFNQAGGVEGCDDQNNNNNDGCLNDCEADPILNDFEITTHRNIALSDFDNVYVCLVVNSSGYCYLPTYCDFTSSESITISENLNFTGRYIVDRENCVNADGNATVVDQSLSGSVAVVTPKVKYNINLTEGATAFTLSCDMNAGLDLNCKDNNNATWVLDAP